MPVVCSVVYSELQRYIKRNSSVLDYRTEAAALFDRLRARGYPPRFLLRAFDKVPSWLSRPGPTEEDAKHIATVPGWSESMQDPSRLAVQMHL